MSSRDMIRLTLLASVLTATNAASTSRIPSSAPAHAVDLPKDFLGISIESANVDKWTGLDKPNPFVQQTLGNLAGLTGVATPVRIGGETDNACSLDHLSNTTTARYAPR